MAFKDIPSLLDSEYPNEKVWQNPSIRNQQIAERLKNYKLEKIAIDDLIKWNDLNNPIALNNHAGIWSETGDEEDIHPDQFVYKPNLDTSVGEVINGTRKLDGSIRLNDGRHRIRALKNGGYTHAIIPIIDENTK